MEVNDYWVSLYCQLKALESIAGWVIGLILLGALGICKYLEHRNKDKS